MTADQTATSPYKSVQVDCERFEYVVRWRDVESGDRPSKRYSNAEHAQQFAAAMASDPSANKVELRARPVGRWQSVAFSLAASSR